MEGSQLAQVRSLFTAVAILSFSETLDDCLSKCNKLHSELKLARTYNTHLAQQIIQLVRNTVTNSQYHTRETPELNHVLERLGEIF